MTITRTYARFVIALVVIVGCVIPLGAQSAPTTSQLDSVSIQVSMQKSSYAIGEKPIAILEIKNSGSKAIWYSNERRLERILITGKAGNPPKTELYRHLLGDFRRGDGPALPSGPVAGRSIAPGSVDSQKYDLSYFYVLNTPGNYSVYLEIYDPTGPKNGSGHWLRTNTVKFEIQAPSQ
ncbi:hypothetical protein GCM10011507_26380 [Edaphobacter acidisoli]|uniref:Uncharacterized protein n=1 Tax=Edaphobacter acidisoli TaxID=2040573 RepID=A0A916RWH5_9BACT|nr:hypothetical protein [Edaphobacter acidisoli]GGA73516.1 hypothetical protein GCM10011507_26380 [Edaphobacter acidisoli]